MKKMKIAYAFIAASLVALLSVSMVNASLDISVTVKDLQINQGECQVITATTNEGGKGILIVLQPALGDPWTDFLIAHPELAALYAELPSDIQTQLMEMIGNKIVSYKLITMTEGGSQDVTFPDDFTGINGEPGTTLNGDYKVIFVFLAKCQEDDQVPDNETPENDVTAGVECRKPKCECRLVELDFACTVWFVVPEFYLGTIAPLLSALIALPAVKLLKKRKHA
jgi:hypothetical protein